jgi:hypothetical protein
MACCIEQVAPIGGVAGMAAGGSCGLDRQVGHGGDFGHPGSMRQLPEVRFWVPGEAGSQW